MARKLPDVLDEPDDRKRVWAAVQEAVGFRVFYVDRQVIWDAIAHELAEQIRRERDAANIPGSPLTSEAVRGMSHAADLIDPEAQ